MKKTALACVFSVILVSPLGAEDDHSLVRFDGGIGVIPVSSITTNPDNTVATGNRNVVRGVNPPGQIWVIRRLRADIGTDGHIVVDGRGLLLGGGNAIGFNANASVIATLICEPAAPFTQHSTPAPGVALAPNGDFRIDAMLSPPPPSRCASPVLLIRSGAGAQPWFAAGIVKLEDDQDDRN
ncbi:MAG TPA: hypothetical protein VKE51_32625 [Vicinamibacterales bacterium]|nr:hypothetical protein [Vicinamibacterales bacterium]